MKIDRKWIVTKSLVIAAFLLAPVLESVLLKRRDRYRIAGLQDHKISFVEKSIFRDPTPIDFLIVGPSGTWVSLNARLIENELSKKFKRKVTVLNFGHIFQGLDLEYFFLRDTLQRREVRNIILGWPFGTQENPNRSLRVLWDPLEDTRDLRAETLARMYSEKLLESVPDIAKNFRDRRFRSFVPFSLHLGSLVLARGYSGNFEPIEIPSLTLQSAVIQNPPVAPMKPLTSYQELYLKKIIRLAEMSGARLFYFISPAILDAPDQSRLYRMTSQNDDRYPTIGVPTDVLFPGLSLEERKKYFFNSEHTNLNGANYFTSALLPFFTEIYESQGR